MIADGEMEVRPGPTQDDPYEVRRYDLTSGAWSEWIEQGELIRRTRGEPGHRELTRKIRQMIKAHQGRAETVPAPIQNRLSEDLTLGEKIERLKSYLSLHPGTRLMDLELLMDAERGPLFILAKKLKERGELLEHPKTRALYFKDQQLPASEDAGPREISVRVLEDLPKIAGPTGAFHLKAGEVATLPESIARALIKKGKAEEVLDIATPPEDVPTATPEVPAPTRPDVLELSPYDPSTVSGDCEIRPMPQAILDAESINRFRQLSREQGEEAAIAVKREEEAPRVEKHEQRVKEAQEADEELLRSGQYKEVIMEALGEEIAGEEPLKELCILSAAQTKLRKRDDQALLHLFIPGDSQVGKSWVFRNAGRILLPKTDFLSFTSMSGKGLNYLADDSNDPRFFEGKVLFVDELAQQNQEARASLKVIMSIGQDEVSNLTVDDRKKSKRQSFTAMPTVWSCSAEAVEDAERQLLNRPMIAAVDESSNQTGLIHSMQKDKSAFGSYYAPTSRKEDALRLMDRIRDASDAEVLVLFSDYYRPDDERARGMIPQFDALITAITFCNRFARPTVTAKDGHQVIFATFEDAIEATRLWGKFIKHKKTHLASRFIEVLEALNELPKRAGQTELDIGDVNDRGKTADDLTVELDAKNGKGWSLGYVRNMLSRLGKEGLAEYHECPDGRSRWVALMRPSHASHFVTYENVTDGGEMLARRISELKRRTSHVHTKISKELPEDLFERILPRDKIPKKEKGA